MNATNEPAVLRSLFGLTPDDAAPYKEAALVGLGVLILYAITLAPSTAYWDTSEYIATAHILGIPHPPGNPLFVVFAKAWSVLLEPFGLPVATRVNLFSALMSASAHALWFLVIHHVLRHFSDSRVFRVVGATAAVAVSATAFTVWSQSNVNEKVYTVTLLTIALLSWLTFLWQERLGRERNGNLLVLMAFILGLSVGNHLMAALAVPAIVIFVLLVHPRALLDRRLYVGVLAAAFAGMSIHLFLPIRAALEPVINEGAPVCENIGSALASIASYGSVGCEALSESLARNQYQKPPLVPRQADIVAQVGNYIQYFDWQWARSVNGTDTFLGSLRAPFTALFTVLGAWGAISHFRKDRPSFYYLATLFVTLSVGLIWYMNFKYGYSYPADGPQEVRERDYFFIGSFSVWGLWAGMGIATLWRKLARERSLTLLRTSPVLLVALIPLALNWQWADRSRDYSARDWAHNLLMTVEPYGVIFTNGDNDTFPLWYLQEVEGIRRDVTVVVTSYFNIDWYVLQLKRITEPCPTDTDPSATPTRIVCQREYTYENTAAAYVSPGEEEVARAQGKVPITVPGGVRRPTRSIIAMSDDEIVARSSRGEVAMGPLTADSVLVFDFPAAESEAEGTFLEPWKQYAIHLIVNAIDDRPIYFASGTGPPLALHLRDHIGRQGLAFRVSPEPMSAASGPDWVSTAGRDYSRIIGDWVDRTRTRLLAEEVYIHRSGLPDWPFWPGPSTLGMPGYYSSVRLALAEAAIESGDQEDAGLQIALYNSWARLARPELDPTDE